MLESFAYLAIAFGLSVLLPTLKHFFRMVRINRNRGSVPGVVVSSIERVASPLGGAGFGSRYETIIQYTPPGYKEPFEIYRLDYNLLMSRDYYSGDGVRVIYDAEMPSRAYPHTEWVRAMVDFGKAALAFALAVVFLVLAQRYG